MSIEMRNLRVGDRFPLSWLEEGEKLGNGYRKKSQSVGRRVFGKDIGVAIWLIESDGDRLVLRDVRDGGRIHMSWPTSPGYESPWGGDGHQRLVQVAEFYEAQAFNDTLSLLSIGRE